MVKAIYLVYFFNSFEDYSRLKIISSISVSALMFLVHSIY